MYEDTSDDDTFKIFIVTSLGFYIASFDKDFKKMVMNEQPGFTPRQGMHLTTACFS